MYYQNNIHYLIHSQTKIPKLIYISVIIIAILLIKILKTEIYDIEETYVYKENNQIKTITNSLHTEEIIDMQYLNYKNKNYTIKEINKLPPEIENYEYDNLEISILDDDLPSEVFIKVKLLKNKQSILKKIIK